MGRFSLGYGNHTYLASQSILALIQHPTWHLQVLSPENALAEGPFLSRLDCPCLTASCRLDGPCLTASCRLDGPCLTASRRFNRPLDSFLSGLDGPCLTSSCRLDSPCLIASWVDWLRDRVHDLLIQSIRVTDKYTENIAQCVHCKKNFRSAIITFGIGHHKSSCISAKKRAIGFKFATKVHEVNTVRNPPLTQFPIFIAYARFPRTRSHIQSAFFFAYALFWDTQSPIEEIYNLLYWLEFNALIFLNSQYFMAHACDHVCCMYLCTLVYYYFCFGNVTGCTWAVGVMNLISS